VKRHRVQVGGLPDWIGQQLLDDGEWTRDNGAWTGERSTAQAADLAARLRGLGFGGRAVELDVLPPLPRSAIRAARTDDAKRRRDTTPLAPARLDLDAQGRWSWTPLALARAIGERAKAQGMRSVLDLGCGAGGNAIGFALAGLQVTAVDLDAGRLQRAKRNAKRLQASVRFLRGDASDVPQSMRADLWFTDPPWGTDWDRTLTPTASMPLLLTLLERPGRPPLWAKLPPSTWGSELADAEIEPIYGNAPGDARRVKFLLARWPAN